MQIFLIDEASRCCSLFTYLERKEKEILPDNFNAGKEAQERVLHYFILRSTRLPNLLDSMAKLLLPAMVLDCPRPASLSVAGNCKPPGTKGTLTAVTHHKLCPTQGRHLLTPELC